MAHAPFRHRLVRGLLIAPPTWSRVARFVLTAWLLALGGIWASQQAHGSLHEHVDLPPLAHLLRDASLAVPLAAVALALGGLLVAWGMGTARRDPAGVGGRLAWALVAALIFAVLGIFGNQVHGAVFGAEEEAGSWLADVLLDSSVLLAASLIVLVPLAMVRLAPWPPDDGEPVAHPSRSAVRPASPGGSLPSFTAHERLGQQGVSRDA